MPWLRRRRRPVPLDPTDPDNVLRTVRDDLPRDGLFAQPVHVARVKVVDPEPIDGGVRVCFVVFLRDDEGRTCPDIAVDATIRGPERTASGQITTDLMGRATFRMSGPAGTYTLTVDDVAAGAMRWVADGDEATSITV